MQLRLGLILLKIAQQIYRRYLHLDIFSFRQLVSIQLLDTDPICPV